MRRTSLTRRTRAVLQLGFALGTSLSSDAAAQPAPASPPSTAGTAGSAAPGSAGAGASGSAAGSGAAPAPNPAPGALSEDAGGEQPFARAPPPPAASSGATRVGEAQPKPEADGGIAPESSAAALLSLAEEAMTTIEYERSRELAEQAIAKGRLDRQELIRAYRLIAVASAQLDDNPAAERAFLRLFAIEPESNIATRIAPARRGAVLEARGFWSLRRDGFGIDVSYARRERQVVVQLRDPIRWAKRIHVWSRFGDRRYVRVESAASAESVFEIEDIGPTDALEVYAFATDEHGNVLLELGRERDPHLFGLSDEELAEFMRRDIRGGQTGSYARRLEELGVQVGVHGYASLEFKPVDDTATFDLHHATLMVRASLLDAVSLEIALEWEHLGREQGDFYLPHAFMDVKLGEPLILRAGFFEVPVGAFNEYLYPDFLRITGSQPLFSRSVVPALWSEVGLQVRGRIALESATHLTYAAFVSNGLQQADAMPNDGMIEEGGDISAMRFNDRDRFSADKAFGGRLGLEVRDFDVGVSGYTGRYTVEADRRLSMADIDLSYRGKYLTFRSEGALALQETSARLLRKYGFYALLAGRPIPYLEPYVEYDLVRLSAVEQRLLAGCAVYPFPNERATRNLRLKSEAGVDLPPEGKAQFVWFFQLTTGF